MLVVLLIISVLLLLFVPEFDQAKRLRERDRKCSRCQRWSKVQAELYELNHTNDQATLSKLIADGNITNKQAESYRAYYAKNSGETRAVAD